MAMSAEPPGGAAHGREPDGREAHGREAAGGEGAAGGSTPLASVIVPARQAGASLPETLERLLDQDLDAPYEVVVACPPQDHDTRAALGRHADDPRLRVVDNPAGSTPAALNAAIAAARADVLVRVDAHALPGRSHVRRCAETLAATGAGNVGGAQLPVARRGFARAVADAMRSRLGSGGATYRSGTEPGPTDTVYLGCFARAALEDVGGFDETLARNQDYELNWRLREHGWTIWFDPELSVGYRPRATVRGLARQYADYGRWKRFMLRRHPRSLRARQLAAPALVVVLTASLALGAATASPWPLLVPAGYVGALLVGGALASRSVARAPATALALAIMHLAWGVGFLVLPVRRGRG